MSKSNLNNTESTFDCDAAAEIGGDIGAFTGGIAAGGTMTAKVVAEMSTPVTLPSAIIDISQISGAIASGQYLGNGIGSIAGYGVCSAGNMLADQADALAVSIGDAFQSQNVADEASVQRQPEQTPPTHQAQSSSDVLQIAISDALEAPQSSSAENASLGVRGDFSLNTAAQAQQPSDSVASAIQNALGSSVTLYADQTLDPHNATSADLGHHNPVSIDTAPPVCAPAVSVPASIASAPALTVDSGHHSDAPAAAAASVPAPVFDAGGGGSATHDCGGGDDGGSSE